MAVSKALFMSMTISERRVEVFFRSAGASLILTAAAKLYSSLGTAMRLAATNPYPHIKNRWLMNGAAAVECLVAVVVLTHTLRRRK